MSNLNKVQLIDRLGDKPELVKNEKTTWHCLIAHNNANFAVKYINTGDLFYIEGKLNNCSFEKDDGQKNCITEIIVSRIKILNSKKQDSIESSFVNE